MKKTQLCSVLLHCFPKLTWTQIESIHPLLSCCSSKNGGGGAYLSGEGGGGGLFFKFCPIEGVLIQKEHLLRGVLIQWFVVVLQLYGVPFPGCPDVSWCQWQSFSRLLAAGLSY